VDVVGIPLSGGFDSSSIVALAANALKGTGTRIVTISSVLGRGERSEERELASKLKDEREYIDALLKMYPEIEAHYITPEELSFTKGLEENMERHYHPKDNRPGGLRASLSSPYPRL
jgi:asparagine synthetase B (glutamine-hydrolysing)